jgi:hypothetical protein
MIESFRPAERHVASTLFLVLITTLFGYSVGSALGQDLPVKVPDLPALSSEIRNEITFDQLHRITGSASDGLVIDLGDTSLQGKFYTGPYPFAAGEADYDYARYRKEGLLSNGKGTLPIADLLK